MKNQKNGKMEKQKNLVNGKIVLAGGIVLLLSIIGGIFTFKGCGGKGKGDGGKANSTTKTVSKEKTLESIIIVVEKDKYLIGKTEYNLNDLIIEAKKHKNVKMKIKKNSFATAVKNLEKELNKNNIYPEKTYEIPPKSNK
jgi:hypothetical protein